ncbi:MAG: 1-deoxy-D-xylulose-5-phosphate reductoisomerase [Terriglobia bacterium]
MQGLCILGSTGSIGQNSLRVIESFSGRFRVIALCAGTNVELLASQVTQFKPLLAVVGSREGIEPLRRALDAQGYQEPIRITAESEGRAEAATLPEVDVVISASHGVTGLLATYAAVQAGKKVALANKETLVAAGELVTNEARRTGAAILPIDSEHCAVHQCLRAGESRQVRRLILTGSGGPFLKTPAKKFAAITPEQALNHPVWRMGGRITVDSATLMNKGLEIIEARWLFGLDTGKIEVLIHPESVIHSMIEFDDRCVMAQLAVADMRIPIQYALTYPERLAAGGDALTLDLTAIRRLNFATPDTRRFPCLQLGRAAIEAGGCLPCVLNAADEVAVSAFLEGRVSFQSIPRIIEAAMQRAPRTHFNAIEDVMDCDREARIWAAEIAAKSMASRGVA